MRSLRSFFERLPGGHRPPMGPLTTSEASEAEAVRQGAVKKDELRVESEHAEPTTLPD